MKEKKREKWTRAKSATGSSKTQKTSLDFKSFLGFRAREACRSAVMENQKKKKGIALEGYLFSHMLGSRGQKHKGVQWSN